MVDPRLRMGDSDTHKPAGLGLPLLGLALGSLALFLVGSDGVGVVDRDEARFALAVREMADRGDWLVPTNWGELRHQKPILIYWLGLLSQGLLGTSVFALRLPSALSMTGTVVLTAWAAARLFGPAVGLRAGWILATTVFAVIQAHAFTADAALLLGTSASFWAWALLRHDPDVRRGPWRAAFWLGVTWGALAKLVNVAYLGAAGAALAVPALGPRARRGLAAALAVGVLAVAIPGAGALGTAVLVGTLGFFAVRSLARDEGRRGWVALGAIWGAPLALGLFAAWGVPALLATDGGFWSRGVEGDLVARTARPFEGHAGVPGYYLATTPIALLPWGALLPAALWLGVRRNGIAPTRGFLLAWLAGPWLLLELVSTKLPHYMLATFPALATLVALELVRREREPGPLAAGWRRLEAALFALPVLGVAVVAAGLALRVDLGWVRLSAGAAALVAVLGAVLGGRALLAGSRRLFPGLALAAAALYAVTFGGVFPALEPLRIAAPLAAAIERHWRPGERLLFHKFTEASVGYALPTLPVEPERIRDTEGVARALAEGPALLVIANAPKARFDRVIALGPLAYEHVDTVRGRIFPRTREWEIWLVRSRAPALAEGTP